MAGLLSWGGEVAKAWGWDAKLVARLPATSAHWVRIQTSLKNYKWATYAKEWSTRSSLPKHINKKKKKLLKCVFDVAYVFYNFRESVMYVRKGISVI